MHNYNYDMYRVKHAEELEKSRHRQQAKDLLEQEAQDNRSGKRKRKRR